MEYNRIVKIWLLIGLFMLIVQIIVGGITRLTGSGLSITKWEIITGTLPPLVEEDWINEFELYKETPQYKKINEGMELGSVFRACTFKFIYFWEYIHRLWARLMGFVFLIPCVFFLFMKWVDPPLLKRLSLVILLAALAASFGWIMVASGLINRPWVNAYKLSFHLCIGISVYAMMLWTCFYAFDVNRIKTDLKRLSLFFTLLVVIQIFFGGIMSGMKAGLFFPTWPDMNGEYFPGILTDFSQYTLQNFNNYDTNTLLPALIQFVHRTTAYVLLIFGVWYFYKLLKEESKLVKSGIVLISVVLVQIVIGILTVINCKGNIPVGYGVMHQGMGIVLLSVSLFINYTMKER